MINQSKYSALGRTRVTWSEIILEWVMLAVLRAKN